jgi:hypothetical protein
MSERSRSASTPGTERFDVERGGADDRRVALGSPMSNAPSTGPRASRPVVGAFLVTAAVVLAVGSVAAWGEYPTGLSQPVAVVLAASATTLLIIGILAFGFPRWGSTRPSPSPMAIAGLVVGLASAVAFAVLVGANLSMTQDSTIPTAARWVPVVIGAIAVVLGLIAFLTARGDGPSRRIALAGAVLGLMTAATSIWLASANCALFVDRTTACSLP